MTLTLTLDITEELERNGELVILAPRLSANELLDFSERNPLLPVEQTAEDYLVIRYPVDTFTSSRNAELCGDLGIWNDALPKMEVDPETYTVKADGRILTCEPAKVLPMAQRYFLF